MTKLCLAVLILTALLPTFSTTSVCAESVGLGVGDLNLNVVLLVGETKEFEAARLYNTGDFDLEVTSTWIPDCNSPGALVEPAPNPLSLIPEESALFYLKVNLKALGSYGGYVDFSCEVKLPENYTGNPSVPRGRAHALFGVAEKPPTPVLPMTPIMTIIAEIIAVIIGTMGILIWYYEYTKPNRGSHLIDRNQVNLSS